MQAPLYGNPAMYSGDGWMDATLPPPLYLYPAPGGPNAPQYHVPHAFFVEPSPPSMVSAPPLPQNGPAHGSWSPYGPPSGNCSYNSNGSGAGNNPVQSSHEQPQEMPASLPQPPPLNFYPAPGGPNAPQYHVPPAYFGEAYPPSMVTAPPLPQNGPAHGSWSPHGPSSGNCSYNSNGSGVGNNPVQSSHEQPQEMPISLPQPPPLYLYPAPGGPNAPQYHVPHAFFVEPSPPSMVSAPPLPQNGPAHGSWSPYGPPSGNCSYNSNGSGAGNNPVQSSHEQPQEMPASLPQPPPLYFYPAPGGPNAPQYHVSPAYFGEAYPPSMVTAPPLPQNGPAHGSWSPHGPSSGNCSYNSNGSGVGNNPVQSSHEQPQEMPISLPQPPPLYLYPAPGGPNAPQYHVPHAFFVEPSPPSMVSAPPLPQNGPAHGSWSPYGPPSGNCSYNSNGSGAGNNPVQSSHEQPQEMPASLPQPPPLYFYPAPGGPNAPQYHVSPAFFVEPSPPSMVSAPPLPQNGPAHGSWSPYGPPSGNCSYISNGSGAGNNPVQSSHEQPQEMPALLPSPPPPAAVSSSRLQEQSWRRKCLCVHCTLISDDDDDDGDTGAQNGSSLHTPAAGQEIKRPRAEAAQHHHRTGHSRSKAHKAADLEAVVWLWLSQLGLAEEVDEVLCPGGGRVLVSWQDEKSVALWEAAVARLRTSSPSSTIVDGVKLTWS